MSRQRTRWLRLVWAALFAVATLLQLPAMTFASTHGSAQQDMAAQQDISAQQDMASAPQHTQAHQYHQHHQHDHGQHDGSFPDAAHDGPPCFALGCCFALGAASVGAPTASHTLLSMLAHAPARVMLPSRPDPAVPPPRLQI